MIIINLCCAVNNKEDPSLIRRGLPKKLSIL